MGFVTYRSQEILFHFYSKDENKDHRHDPKQIRIKVLKLSRSVSNLQQTFTKLNFFPPDFYFGSDARTP
jgi:hypothetical protein